MKAAIKHHRGAGLRVEDVPLPTIGPGDVLIKVLVASICGSDVPIYDWSDPWVQNTIQPGQIIGHEFCGIVSACGSEVQRITINDFVTAEGHLHCGQCRQCRCGEAHVCPRLRLVGFDYPGAFAEYISIPASNVIKLPHIPPKVAAILDPFGNAVHATTSITLSNATVLITGCGPLGLMATSLARLFGARLIVATDISHYRLELVETLGATHALKADDPTIVDVIKELTRADSGVDVLLEMSGSPAALVQGFRLLRPGGHAVLLGLPKYPVTFDFSSDLITKGITVHGITGRVMFRTWDQLLKLVGDDGSPGAIDLDPVITHSVSLDEIEEGFHLMQSGNCGKVAIIVDPDSAQLAR